MKKSDFIKQLKEKRCNNRGVALITVVVAVGFVAALVSILLTTTLVNFKMKAVNERGKDSFYSAERVLDEITVGLQRRVSDALSSSYIEILENYGDSAYDNEKKKQLVQTKYYERMWSYLEADGKGNGYYDTAKLEAFLKKGTVWYPAEDTDGDGVNDAGGYGAIISAVVTDASSGKEYESPIGEMITFKENGIVLKNLRVYYKDVYGFVSVIQTDIRLNYPEFDFAKSSVMADIAEYTFIADGGAEKTTGGTLALDGNMYANALNLKGVNVTTEKENLLIVKHDLLLDGGASLTTGEDNSIWAKNIKVKSSTFDATGVTSVSNDLNILGKESKIRLEGEYYGYGNSIEDSDQSSSILINGKKSKIDLSKLVKFTLSGHAFLGTSSAVDVHGVEGMTDSYENVYTGESIAIKSDQLAYLVPAEAIGVDDKTGRSYYNSNPLTKEQYNKIMALVNADKNNPSSETNYKLVSDSVGISALGCSLSEFIKYGEDGTTPEIYKHEVRVSDEKVGSIVYLYLLFDDEAKANEYFNVYYNNSETALSKYTKAYLSEIKLPTAASAAAFITAGNTYASDTTDTIDGVKVYPASQQNANMVLEDDSYNNRLKFKAFTTKLIPNFTELKNCKYDNTTDNNPDNTAGQVVFENIASDQDGLWLYIDRCEGDATFGGLEVTKTTSGIKSGTLTFKDSDDNYAIVTTDDYTVVSDKVHLVISAGNVKVNVPNYTGVILCDGKLTLNSAVVGCKKEPDLVRKCLQFGYEKDGLTYTIMSCLADGNDYVYATYGKGGTSNTSLTGLVTYENWKKE